MVVLNKRMNNTHISTGYGPRQRLPYFDGNEERYELWEVKFMGQMRIQKLHKVISPRAEEDEEDGPDHVERNADAFAELVQCLDDRSLNLVIRDAKDNGREALKILREHYLGKSKPRVIGLYTELTTLMITNKESITDYVIRAETAATSLNNAGETISDGLLIAMVLKGLPPSFATFRALINQKEAVMKFAEFKVTLRSYEETERSTRVSIPEQRNNHVVGGAAVTDNVMLCWVCNKPGHKAYECRNNTKTTGRKTKSRWCGVCKNSTHDTKYCRKKDFLKTLTNFDNEQQEQSSDYAFKASDIKVNTPNSLLVDCGATAHIINDKSKFLNFDKEFDATKHLIELADGSRTNGIVKGKGDAEVLLYDINSKPCYVKLENALYVPSYKQDIFSVQAAITKGASVNFNPSSANLIAPNGTLFDIEKQGKLYYLCSAIAENATHDIKEWHNIMGHCNVRDILKLEGVVTGMKIKDKADFECEVCIEGKMSSYRNRKPDRRATQKLELVHADLAGPITPESEEGYKYALCFVDDYTNLNVVYFLKHKHDTAAATERFLADMAKCGSVKCIRTDNGTEFTGNDFESILVRNKIKHERSAPYSAHQNGTVERAWRTLFDMARCMILESKLSKSLWPYAVMASAYIRNRCYNSRLNKTPYEAMSGHKPDLSNMHIFGTVCYAYVQNKTKLDARSEKGIFLGYDKGSPAYLVYIAERNVVKKVRCVKFTDKFDVIDNVVEDEDDYGYIRLPENVKEHEDEVEHDNNNESVIQDNDKDHFGEGERYPVRTRGKPKYLDDFVTQSDIESEGAKCTIDYCYKVENVPNTYKEALNGVNSQKWQDAMNDEINSLHDNNTFNLTPVPEDRDIVGGRWVYAVKVGETGDNYKARYVAKGYSQIPDVDYHETFAPTASITSVRALMQIAVQNDMIVHQMDVKTAYLNAPIDTEIYMEQPEGFRETGPNGEELVCKLNKSLYGLKQSGRNWNRLLHNHLCDNGYKQNDADHCVYKKCTENGTIIIVIWVDDIVVAASNAL